VPPDIDPPDAGDDWLGLTGGPLPVGAAYEWAGRPDCGAVVVFSGTARDHAEGRPGVTGLHYEAYADQVVPRLAAVAEELRRRWPSVGRVVLIHRTGDVPIGGEAVVVVVSAPHRTEAFDAARFGIDAVKSSVPIWKRERWAGGEDWGLEADRLVEPTDVDRHLHGVEAAS
jgi:molybdopterin synthase catalytic subunit